MSSVVDKLTDIVDGIKKIPSKIGELPELIINGIKAIFIPDTEVIKFQFNNMVSRVENKMGFSTSSIENLKNSWQERPIEDVSTDYKFYGLNTMKIKILDTSYLNRGIEFFRPIIRGFIVLLLCFYNYKMILSFIGQDPGMYASAKEEAEK